MTDTPDEQLDDARAEVAAMVAAGHDHEAVAVEMAVEVLRLRSLLNPELTFRDMEMKIRDGKIDLRAVTGDETQPVFRMLAGMMLHFVMGEGGPDDVEEPPNYRSGELVLRPANGFEEVRAAIEIIKPGGKSSHQIRTELEAEVASLRAVRPAQSAVTPGGAS